MVGGASAVCLFAVGNDPVEAFAGLARGLGVCCCLMSADGDGDGRVSFGGMAGPSAGGLG